MCGEKQVPVVVLHMQEQYVEVRAGIVVVSASQGLK
jgi:hypothetical protein